MMDDTSDKVDSDIPASEAIDWYELARFLHDSRGQRIELNNLYPIMDRSGTRSEKFIEIDVGKGLEECIPYIAIAERDQKDDCQCTADDMKIAKELYSRGCRWYTSGMKTEQCTVPLLDDAMVELNTDCLLIYWLPWKDMMCRLTLGVGEFTRLNLDGKEIMLPSKLVLNIP